MAFRRAKSPQDLYEEVASYDLVLVPDNPLADAINRRLERPHVGPFATTPKRYAAGWRGREDRPAFLEVVDEVDAGWKELSMAVADVLDCWQHTGDPEGVLAHDAYVDDTTRAVVDVLRDSTITHARLATARVPPEQAVAVVGEDQLTPLERRLLPSEYTSIDRFGPETIDTPTFDVFDAKRDVVDAVTSVLTRDNADHVAVVLDRASEYSSLLEAALEAADIPFHGGPRFTDDPDHRAVMQLMRTGVRGSDLTVGEVRPLLARLGGRIAVEHDDKRLVAFDHPATEWIESVRADVGSFTFGEVLEAYEDRTGRSLERFAEELETLGRLDVAVTADRLDQLSFYLETFEVPVDRDDEGVLLADARSAAYVDRPSVFFLGLDEDWTRTPPRRPWIDEAAHAERYLRAFESLLQSGDRQYYLVQDAAGGRTVTPCLYFRELIDRDFDRFSDLPSTTYDRSPAPVRIGFEVDPPDVETTTVEPLSQSRLNAFVNCPRDYLFDELVDSPDRVYFREGTLFHDFAEVYANNPDEIDEGLLDEVVDLMVDAVEPFVPETSLAVRRTKYRMGLEAIVAFLDANRPADVDVLTSTSGWGTNAVAEHLDLPVDLPVTEHWFENDDLGISGKIDLVQAADRLVDYKSGRQSRATTVVNRSATDPPDRTPDFQAIMYLLHWRTVNPGEPLEFVFVHFLEVVEDLLEGEASIDDACTRITYRPVTFDHWARSREAFDRVREEGPKDCRETFDLVEFEDYVKAVSRQSFPSVTDYERLKGTAAATGFVSAIAVAGIEADDPTKGAYQGLRMLNDERRQSFFKRDLDQFEEFLEEARDRVNALRAGEERFPIDGLGGEPNYRRVNHRDLLVEGRYDG